MPYKFIVLQKYTLLIITILVIGCKSSSVQNIEFNGENKNTNITTLSTKNIKVKHIALNPEKIYGLFTSIVVIDSFLVCGNLRADKLISIYSLNGDSLITEVIKRGTGLNEGLSASSLFSKESNTDSPIWLHDITLSKLFKINIIKALRDNNYISENEVMLSKELKNIVSPQIYDDTIIVATTYSWDDNRYMYASNKKIIKKVGKLPDVKNGELLTDAPNTKFPNKPYIFKATGIKHPLDTRIAVFYNKTDRVEFYLKDSLIKTIVGPDKFGPRMEVTKLQSGFSIEDFDKTLFSFTSIASTQDYIYCLYAGAEKGKTCSNRIFVFDWDGVLKEELILDRPVCKICINSKKKILYCYENTENGIFSASLD
jgi:hypothetical protein